MKCIPLIISLVISYSTFGQINRELRESINNSIATETQNKSVLTYNDFHPVSGADVFWTKEVLRSIDFSVAPNNQLLHIKTAKNTDQTIISVLLQALTDNDIRVFATVHDSISLNQKDAVELITKIDAVTLTKAFLLESWRFDPSIKKMAVKIIGIAPCRFDKKDTSHCEAIFWIKYASLRQIFKQDHIANMTVNDFFENRMFSSTILNVSTVDTVCYKSE